jgi:hypothetical protein
MTEGFGVPRRAPYPLEDSMDGKFMKFCEMLNSIDPASDRWISTISVSMFTVASSR